MKIFKFYFFCLIALAMISYHHVGAQVNPPPEGLRFNGSGQYMSIPSHADFDIPQGEALTISFWVKHDRSPNTGNQRLVNRFYTSNSDEVFGQTGFGSVLLPAGGYHPYVDWRLGTPGSTTTVFNQNRNGTTGIFEAGEWHHVAVVYENAPGGGMTLYADAVVLAGGKNANVPTGDIRSSSDVYVGGGRGNATVAVNEFLLGEMANLRFYKKAMTQEEIQADMTAEVTAETPDLAAAYDFQNITSAEGGDFVVADIKGNHPGVLTNYSWQAPTITTQPQTVQAIVGKPFALSVVATAHLGKLTYQWFSNETASNEGGEPIEGADEATYAPDTETIGDYYFYVVVTATLGALVETTTSQPITLEVIEEPLYEVTVTDGTGSGSFPEGATVNVSADAPPAGKMFSHWTSEPEVAFDDVVNAATSFVMPACAVTVTANYKEEQDENFPAGNGKGSAEFPYQITSAEELATLATLVNAGNVTYRTAHYILMDNIDLDVAPYNTGQGWTPIGTAANSFQGVFDGAGNAISDLYINRSANYQGLFGVSGNTATIKNLGVNGDVTIGANAWIGGIVGCALGGNIENCWFSGNVTSNYTSSSGGIGGIAGQLGDASNLGTMSNCWSDATITSTTIQTGGLVGLLRGISNTEISTVVNSYFSGTVVANGGRTGGIAGTAQFGGLSNCYVTGDVTGGNNVNNAGWAGGFGGIVGFGYTYCLIENCYVTGAVTESVVATANMGAGGIMGFIYQSSTIIIKNSAALNSKVTGGATTCGRIWGAQGASTTVTLSDNIAFSGMTNAAGTTDWGECLADNKNGTNKTSAEIRAAGFFQSVFTGDLSAWTFAENSLPGLRGSTVELPVHLIEQQFALSESGEYVFPKAAQGYGTLSPLTVTVSNLLAAAIGPLSIELTGANVATFQLSATSIANIAAGGDASFTVAPITGLNNGLYKATVTVANDSKDFYLSFDVSFNVTDGNSGIPDVSWYNADNDIFTIRFADELAGLAQLVNGGNTFAAKTVTLANDIDLTAYGSGQGWAPIGTTTATTFQGRFDGADNTISNLFISRPSGLQGLFGSISGSAEIKNLGVIGNIARTNVQTGDNANECVGGIVGYALGGSITNCWFSGSVTNNGVRTGGIAGRFGNAVATMTNCWSDATVMGMSIRTGGLAGELFGPTLTTGHSIITNSYFTGSVTSNDGRAGGIVGMVDKGTISNCYSTGAITRIGIATYSLGPWAPGVGGIAGYVHNSSVIENCYSTGLITSDNTTVGGIVGFSQNVTAHSVRNCAALNLAVKGTATLGRVAGSVPALSDNIAFSGITNNVGTANWGVCNADNLNGADKNAVEIRADGFFQSVFAGDDLSAWTFAEGKLPGLNGEPVDMPSHLLLAPTITLQPQGSTITQESSYVLSVTVAPGGGGVLAYQWFGNTTESNEDGEAIPDATESTYETPNTLTPGTYFFYVVVTNTVESASATTTSDVATLVISDEKISDVTVVSTGREAAGTGKYTEGNVVNIFAGTLPSGLLFSHWTSDPEVDFDDANSATTFFTMPAEAVTVTAQFVGKQGIAFNGSSQYITIPSHTDFDIREGEELTIAFWVKITGKETTTTRLVHRIHGTETGYSTAYVTNPNFYADCRYGGANNRAVNGTNAVCTLNEWDHFAVVYRLTNPSVTLYRNGISIGTPATGTHAGEIINTADVHVGVGSNGPGIVNGQWFLGEMADLRFYKTALTQAEIQADMTAEVTASTPDLVAAYDFQNITVEGDDLVLADLTGNHQGVLHGYKAKTPNITTHPQGDQVTIGNPFTLSVVVLPADGGVLTYQWYSSSSGSIEDGKAIESATSPTYDPDTGTVGAYYFYVVVTNTIDISDEDLKVAKATSEVATLNVIALPTYAVTVSSAGTGASGAGNYIEGATVTINAGTAPLGQVFKNWTSTPAVAFDNANSAATFFSMPAEAVIVTAHFEAAKYTATLNVNKDDAAWEVHGKTFTLKLSTDDTQVETMTGADGTLTANVVNGTWKVYDGDNDTGATIVINNTAGIATLNYYTIEFSVVEAGTADGSTINATYDGNLISSGVVVFPGKPLTIMAYGAAPGTSRFTYVWSGTATGTEATYSVSTVNAKVDAVCTVTGSRITSAEDLQANPLKAWVNNGILHVSGIAEGKLWKLYSATGALVKQGIADSDPVMISLELPGMYIIQSEGNTIKFVY